MGKGGFDRGTVIRTTDTSTANGPWVEAVRCAEDFEFEVNRIIDTYNKQNKEYQINHFNIRSNKKDFNDDMDILLQRIEALESAGGPLFYERLKLDKLRNKFSEDLEKLQIHILNACFWNPARNEPIIDLYYRVDVNGEVIPRSANNYRKIFQGKYFVAFYFKVS